MPGQKQCPFCLRWLSSQGFTPHYNKHIADKDVIRCQQNKFVPVKIHGPRYDALENEDDPPSPQPVIPVDNNMHAGQAAIIPNDQDYARLESGTKRKAGEIELRGEATDLDCDIDYEGLVAELGFDDAKAEGSDACLGSGDEHDSTYVADSQCAEASLKVARSCQRNLHPL